MTNGPSKLRLQTIMEVAADQLDWEERLHVAQFSVDRTADGVYWVNHTGRFLYVNNASCRSLGYSREELLSMAVADIDPNFPAETWPSHWQEVRERGSFTLETPHKRKDGSLFPVEITVNFLEHTGREYNCAFARNITERKQWEVRITALNEDLRKMVDDLRAANTDLETLVHAISHDLRSPLTAVQGFADLLLEETSKAFEPKQIHYLELISKSGRRMSTLIDSLLRFFALSRNTIQFLTVNTKEIVEDTWRELIGLHPEERARLVVKDLPATRGDPIMIRQVFLNLLQNALKFRRPQVTTTIEVGARVETGMNVYYVKDNGIGFSNEQAKKVFNVFERLNVTEKYEGTGVGLGIVKRIVERHGGRIWAEGKKDVGATFYFTLPLGG